MSEEIIIQPSGESRSFKYSQSACPGRILLKDLLEDGGASFVGKTVTVAGWIRTARDGDKGAFVFVQLFDGTTSKQVQVLVRPEVYDIKQLSHTGTAIVATGEVVASIGQGQAIEIQATKVSYVSGCDPNAYPLSKKEHTLEFLREKAHLRSRTNLFGCVFRIRNSLSQATHKFFNERNFLYAHTPIITASDCEGAGEMFQLTTLLPSKDKVVPEKQVVTDEEVASLEAKIAESKEVIGSLKSAKASKDEITAAVNNMKSLQDELKALKERPTLVGGLPYDKEGKLMYTEDFFKVPAHLTVSGQLQAEAFACSLSNTYTFGPTFRAEESFTSRHLAEFWMIEPEVAFADLFDVMALAEDYVKYCCQYVLDHNLEDLVGIDNWQAFEMKKEAQLRKKNPKAFKDEENKRTFTDPSVTRMQKIVQSEFKRISYTEVIDILLDAISKGKVFKNEVHWGIDLASEHERFVAEEVFNLPCIVYNYPKDIKAFYMRQNEDSKTVAAMDILVPQIGELIGGSQREEREEVLRNRVIELNMDPKDFWWYLELRKFGTVPHAGFGLGFERLIMFVTGIENIKDVIPFPRWCENINF